MVFNYHCSVPVCAAVMHRDKRQTRWTVN